MADKKLRSSDGSLEVEINPQGEIIISSPRAPSILVSLVDHTNNGMENPPEAIYRIGAFNPRYNKSLNEGDVFEAYVGARGVLLGDSGRKRIIDDYEK